MTAVQSDAGVEPKQKKAEGFSFRFDQSGDQKTRSSFERDRIAFLPAALEILETPASPLGRTIAGTIILSLVIALIWSIVGHVDIIASAAGKVIPSDRVKVIQPFETGVVRALHVRDGQEIKAGQVLVELDATINTAERDRLAKDLVVAQLDIWRFQSASLVAMQGSEAARAMPLPVAASVQQIAGYRALLESQLEEYRAKIANIDRQISQHQFNIKAIVANIEKLEESIPLLQQRVDARKYLADKGYGSKLLWLEIEQNLTEYKHELRVQKARQEEAGAAVAALHEQRRQTEAEFLRTNRGELTQAEQKAASLQEQVVQIEQRRKLQTLLAPVDGTVQQLAIHTVGGVVTPAQALMVVVPADSKLEVEAMIPNREVGFVEAGQRAEVKIDTFNFTRYGLIEGTVVSVSQDAIVREKPSDRSSNQQDGTLAKSSEPQGQELLYSARIALDRTQMQIDNRLVNLTPGMAVTVEIKTGTRRLIEYILSPLLRYKQESLRER